MLLKLHVAWLLLDADVILPLDVVHHLPLFGIFLPVLVEHLPKLFVPASSLLLNLFWNLPEPSKPPQIHSIYVERYERTH